MAHGGTVPRVELVDVPLPFRKKLLHALEGLLLASHFLPKGVVVGVVGCRGQPLPLEGDAPVEQLAPRKPARRIRGW